METNSDAGAPLQPQHDKDVPGASRIPAECFTTSGRIGAITECPTECLTAIREKNNLTLPNRTSKYQKDIKKMLTV